MESETKWSYVSDWALFEIPTVKPYSIFHYESGAITGI
jgi:hypothetical protein